jgi:hypothetical protein
VISYFKRVARFYTLMASVPLIVGFVGAWSAGFGFLLFIFGVPTALIILAVGAILCLVRAAKLAIPDATNSSRAIAICVSPALLAVTLMVALPLVRTGNFVGSFTRLFINRGHYEEIIAKAQSARSPVWYEDDAGVTYSTDLGPPVRVAFNPEGILDNWSGIIYDPTGDVMLAKGFDAKTGKFAAPDRVTKLFNGDLVGCNRLWRSYYICSFT